MLIQPSPGGQHQLAPVQAPPAGARAQPRHHARAAAGAAGGAGSAALPRPQPTAFPACQVWVNHTRRGIYLRHARTGSAAAVSWLGAAGVQLERLDPYTSEVVAERLWREYLVFTVRGRHPDAPPCLLAPLLPSFQPISPRPPDGDVGVHSCNPAHPPPTPPLRRWCAIPLLEPSARSGTCGARC